MVRKLFKNPKNHFVLMTLALMLAIVPVQAAFAAEEYLYMLPNEHSVTGDFVWISKGDSVYYEWLNDGSIHGVGFGVYYFDGSSKLISNKTAGSGNGGAWASFTAPYTGNYFLKANCGGAGQTGCVGSGFIRY
ncbi:hypothetical protein [Brevibacillus nitrificans]|uniref:hypothetical protein n=1 Tax=Brevibacillus nitrificans TaxID=651560 RepID=UPI001326A1FA|nr:hypothetical protein [Brevibacillus nitrificans]KAB3587160.1 hypothetical protein GAY21_23580 [Phocaeicola vulgatus]